MKLFKSTIFCLCLLIGTMAQNTFGQSFVDDFDVTGNNLNFTGCLAVIHGQPVVADLEDDGIQEIIINDATRLWVYEYVNNAYVVRNNFPVNIPDGNLTFTAVSAIGKLDVFDASRIVMLGIRQDNQDNGNIHNTYFSGKLYVFNGQNGSLLASSATGQFGKAQPVLADLQGLEEGSLECDDGLNEIVTYGLYQVQYNAGIPLTGYAYNLRVYRYDGDNLVSMNNGTGITAFSSSAPEDPTLAPVAIGDMNGDGDKEIVGTKGNRITCWTLIRSDGSLTQRWDTNASTGFGGVGLFEAAGPTLVDIAGDGSLIATAAFDRFNGQLRTTILGYDYSGNLMENWNGANANTMPRFAMDGGCLAVGDKEDDGILTFGLGLVSNGYWRGNDNGVAVGCVGWPVDLVQGFEKYTSIARIGVESPDVPRLIISGADANGAIRGYRPNSQNGSDFTLSSPDQKNTGHLAPTVTDIDGDGTLEICYGSMNEDWTAMHVDIYRFDGSTVRNSQERVEWTQLGNSPRHENLYSQPYSGTLPPGLTLWHDRVSITADVLVNVNANNGAILGFDNRAGSVIEFNENCYVRIHNGTGLVRWQHYLGPRVVLKPNSINQDNNWGLVYNDYSWNWPLDPEEQPKISGLDVRGGTISVGEGNGLLIEDVNFIGDGDNNALTVTDATNIEIKNCSFNNYVSALGCNGSNVTIEDCTFENMTGTVASFTNCTSTNAISFVNCTFSNSNVGVYLNNAIASFEDCTFENMADYGFDIAACSASNAVVLDGVTITDCGCGIKANNSYVSLTNTSITGSWDTANYGNGIYLINCAAGKVKIDGCTVSNNGCGTSAGNSGIYLSSSSPEIVNTTIEGNTGGGIYCSSSSPDLNTFYSSTDHFNTIHANGGLSQSGSNGAEIYLSNTSTPVIRYNNIWDDVTGANGKLIYKNGGTATVTATDNWWGISSPLSSFFYWPTGSGTIVYSPWSSSKYIVPVSAEEFDYAMQLWEDGNYVEAAEHFRNCVPDEGANGINSVHYLMGCVGMMENSDYDGLRTFLTEAAANHQDPEVAKVARRFATDCLTQQQLYEDAMQEYESTREMAECLEDSVAAATDYWSVYELANGDNIDAAGDRANDKLKKMRSMLNGSRDGSAKILPTELILSGCYPNPFNGITSISFALHQSGNLKLGVYDMSGREVTRLAEGRWEAGTHRVSWQADGVPTGVYLVRLESAGAVQSMKAMLIK